VQQPGGKGASSGGERESCRCSPAAAVAVGVAGVFIRPPDPDHAPSTVQHGPLREFEALVKTLMGFERARQKRRHQSAAPDGADHAVTCSKRPPAAGPHIITPCDLSRPACRPRARPVIAACRRDFWRHHRGGRRLCRRLRAFTFAIIQPVLGRPPTCSARHA